MAGLIAGNGKNSTGNNYTQSFYGTAPNANLVDLRALDATGAGTDSSVIAAIALCWAQKLPHRPRGHATPGRQAAPRLTGRRESVIPAEFCRSLTTVIPLSITATPMPVPI